jgi:tetratricopeptide (TPR) repeat protein
MGHSVEYSLQKAKNKLRKGQIGEAEKAYESILLAFPGNIRAKEGLENCKLVRDRGVNSVQTNINGDVISQYYSDGKHAEVIELSKLFLQKYPDSADVLLKMGASYGVLEDYQNAQSCFEKVKILQPQDPAPWNNIGTLLKMQNDIESATGYYEKALEIDPRHFDSLKNLSFCLGDLKKTEDAIEYLQRALAVRPENFELHNHLGSLLSKLNKIDEAEKAYKRALEIKPDYNVALNNLGNVYYGRQEYDKAIELYESAIAFNPTYGDAHNNLANVLKDTGFLDEAIYHYKKSIEFRPDKAELYSNYSVVLKDKYELEESLIQVEKAIELKPDFYDAYWNKALAQLAGKNYKDGWKSYEWRWKATNFDSTFLATSRPLWDGKKERVLIWQEQGIGDQIMFSTMFEEFALLCEVAIFQVDRRLLPIFRRTFPQFYFIPGDKKLAEHEYDSHIPMGSMPQYLRNSESDFRNATPTKLKADMNSAQKIRQAFRIGDRQLVGISWRSINKSTGVIRSLSLSEFLGGFQDKDVELVNLQYGDCKDEIEQAYKDTGIAVKSVNEIDTFTNIDHLASLIQCCDRIITIDNSTLHLAASMGKPSDLLLPYITDWRWCGGKSDPVWYDCLKVHSAPYGVHLKDCIVDLIDDCFTN